MHGCGETMHLSPQSIRPGLPSGSDGTTLLDSTPATSALGLGSPLPHPRRDWAHPFHSSAATGLTPATSKTAAEASVKTRVDSS